MHKCKILASDIFFFLLIVPYKTPFKKYTYLLTLTRALRTPRRGIIIIIIHIILDSGRKFGMVICVKFSLQYTVNGCFHRIWSIKNKLSKNVHAVLQCAPVRATNTRRYFNVMVHTADQVGHKSTLALRRLISSFIFNLCVELFHLMTQWYTDVSRARIICYLNRVSEHCARPCQDLKQRVFRLLQVQPELG